jgi:hypothetical protein
MVGRVAPRAPRLSTGVNEMTEIAIGPIAFDQGYQSERLGPSGARGATRPTTLRQSPDVVSYKPSSLK